MNPKELHDSILNELQFDWASGVLLVLFTTGIVANPRVQLILENVTVAEFCREFPWGRSASVNVIEIIEGECGTKCKIEMQSGDILYFVCKKVSFTKLNAD